MRYITMVAALWFATTCFGADAPPNATRVIDGVKSTFPLRSVPAGVKALTGVLESCRSKSDSTIRYTVDELKNAQKGDHLRFVFPRPLQVEVLETRLPVSEAVYANGVFWLACGKDLVRCTKFTHDKMERFEAWYRQPQ